MNRELRKVVAPASKTIWIAILALSLPRLALIAFGQVLSGDDGDRYLLEALNLWSHGTFSTDSGAHPSPTAHDLPLFPLLMAGLLVIFKNTVIVVRIVAVLNCVLFCVAARGVYALAHRLTGHDGTALTAMLVFGVFPESFPYSVFYMPEALFLALFVWCLVNFSDYGRTGAGRALPWTFVLWGLSTLTKPIAVFFGPALAVVAFLIAFRQRHLRNPQTVKIMASFCLGLLLILPWMVRNYVDFREVGISSITGSQLFDYNYRYLLEELGVQDPPAVMAEREAAAIAAIPPDSNPMVVAKARGKVAQAEILSHLGAYAWMSIKRHWRLYAGTGAVATLRLLGDTEACQALQNASGGPHSWSSIPARAITLQLASWLILGLAYAAALLGLASLMKDGEWSTFWWLVLVVAYFALLIGPVTATRYRMAMLPALSIAAAIGLNRLWMLRRTGRTARA